VLTVQKYMRRSRMREVAQVSVEQASACGVWSLQG
jgi:hypothetical protein